MKRFIACMMAIALVFGIAGCAQDTSKQDSEAVVTKYYDYLKKGDYESAAKLHTSDVSDGNDLAAITDSIESISDQMKSSSLSDEQSKKVNDSAKHFAKDTIQQYVRDYTVKSDGIKVNDDKNKATVKVTVKGIDLNDFSTTIYDNEMMKSLTDKYSSKIQSLLEDSSTTTDQINDVAVDMTLELFQNYESKIDALKSSTHTETITLVKKGKDKDAKWKITKIKVDTPSKSSTSSSKA